MSESSIRRHRAEHVPASLTKAAEVEDVVQAGTLLEQIKALRDRSLSILNKAEDAGDLRTALAGIREARVCIELLLEVEGELDRRNVVNVHVSAEWLEIRAILLDSLSPYPNARQAVAASLTMFEGSRHAG